MDLPVTAPRLRGRRPADEPGEQPPVIEVRPVRAAFGPVVSVVSVDQDGRLWIRFSAALGVFVASLLLMTIPLGALWWVTEGLAESGQVTFRDDTPAPVVVPDGASPSGELPLADPDPARRAR